MTSFEMQKQWHHQQYTRIRYIKAKYRGLRAAALQSSRSIRLKGTVLQTHYNLFSAIMIPSILQDEARPDEN